MRSDGLQDARKEWAGRWDIDLYFNDDRYGEGRIILWRWLEDHQIAVLFAECKMPYPDTPYEASQVEDTFSTKEMEAIKKYFEAAPDITRIEVRPARQPIQHIEGNTQWCGMSPFGDMYCGMVGYNLSDILPGLMFSGTITHYTTPDGRELRWDESSGSAVFDTLTGAIWGESDKNVVLKEFEENSGGDSDVPDAFRSALDD